MYKISILDPWLTRHGFASVDLTAASCVHLIEPQWNPMVEAQTLDRVHRIGQVRDVVITRYIVRNSIENVGILYLTSTKERIEKHYIIADTYPRR